MKVEILGSGGSITIPKPLCDCTVCSKARKKGGLFARTGPSVFVHGPNILFDTPEEIKMQLNRSRIGNINACFYSHWHPDHTMGRRVWDMNKDWINIPPKNRTTKVYLPQNVVPGMKQFIGNWEHLNFFHQTGIIDLIEIPEGEEVSIRDCVVRPLKMAEEYVCVFEVKEFEKRILIVMDEHIGWKPGEDLLGMDLLILPMGVCEFDPFTGKRRIHEKHELLKTEATFEYTLELIKRLDAKMTVISHIEEPDNLSYDDLILLERKLRREGYRIKFAYDTFTINV